MRSHCVARDPSNAVYLHLAPCTAVYASTPRSYAHSHIVTHDHTLRTIGSNFQHPLSGVGCRNSTYHCHFVVKRDTSRLDGDTTVGLVLTGVSETLVAGRGHGNDTGRRNQRVREGGLACRNVRTHSSTTVNAICYMRCSLAHSTHATLPTQCSRATDSRLALKMPILVALLLRLTWHVGGAFRQARGRER